MVIARGSSDSAGFEYEKVVVDEWITGTIDDVEARYNHPVTWQGVEKLRDQVRFVFKLDGYEYPHRSVWTTLSTHEKSNLYKKYIKPIFKLDPDSTLDLDKMKGLKVKIMWVDQESKDGKVYQHVSQIRATDQEQVSKLDLTMTTGERPVVEEMPSDIEDGETPF